MAKAIENEVESVNTDTNLSQGYIMTSNVDAVDLLPSHQGALSLISAEIDSTIFAYHQLTANYCMSEFLRTGYSDAPTMHVVPGNYIGGNQLAMYSEIWKINFRLQDQWREYYRWLTDDCVIRVYNNEPVLLATCTGSGYVVLHPSIQSEIETGNDEYGAYYEVNVGGVPNSDALVGTHNMNRRYMSRARGYPRPIRAAF